MSDEETPVQYDPRTDEYMCPSCGMMAPRLRYDNVNDVEVPRETCRFCGVPVPDLSKAIAVPGTYVITSFRSPMGVRVPEPGQCTIRGRTYEDGPIHHANDGCRDHQ